MTDVVAVGFIPAAPLLVPAVAGGSAPLDGELRDACRTVVRRLCDSGADAVLVAASWPEGIGWPADPFTWGFEGFGVRRDPADDRPRLPWPLGIGDWLLEDVGWSGSRCFVTVGPDGRTSAAVEPSRVAVLTVGDGSARRSEKAPGHFDNRAESFDAEIGRALAAGDAEALGGLDPALASDLLCAGVPVWRWLASLLGKRPVAEPELLAETAPYGVGYFVAHWHLAEPAVS